MPCSSTGFNSLNADFVSGKKEEYDTVGISRRVAHEVNCTAVDELHRFELTELVFICLYL